MYPGYNTNGFAHHRLEDACAILSELGYQGIALTLDYHVLNPFAPGFAAEVTRVRRLLERHSLRCVIETGARFLLDPRRKHQPTLLTADAAERQHRIDFLTRAIDLARDLEAEAVSFWSGSPIEKAPFEVHLDRLVAGCQQLAEVAATKEVRLAFEPEPGMLIDTMERFAQLHERVGHPAFGLTLDLGHLHCLGELPISAHLQRWRPWLWNIHIEDMKRGLHDHLPFGEGDMDFVPIFRTLREIGYGGGLYVELSRHSHNAVETARRSIAWLRQEGRINPVAAP